MSENTTDEPELERLAAELRAGVRRTRETLALWAEVRLDGLIKASPLLPWAQLCASIRTTWPKVGRSSPMPKRR